MCLQILGVRAGDESAAAVADQGEGQQHLARVPQSGRRLSGERGLQVDRFGARGRPCGRHPESLVLRCGRRARLPSDEERLVLALLAIGHVQGLPERLTEEGQVHTESVWREALSGYAERRDATRRADGRQDNAM